MKHIPITQSDRLSRDNSADDAMYNNIKGLLQTQTGHPLQVLY